MTLIKWPAESSHYRIITKRSVFETVSNPRSLRGKLAYFVQRIAVINQPRPIPADETDQIYVVLIESRVQIVPDDVLRAIDALFSGPVIFEIRFESLVYSVACYKRKNAAGVWCPVGNYIRSAESVESSERQSLPKSRNFIDFYHAILNILNPVFNSVNPSALGQSDPNKIIYMKERITEILNLVAKEYERKKRLELNLELRAIYRDLHNLLGA